MGCFQSTGYVPLQRIEVKPKHWIDLERLVRTAHTGDILLFKGRGLASAIINVGSDSMYSHVAMVVVTDRFGVCLWESSTPDGCIDVITRTNKDGPRLIPLRQKLSYYLEVHGYAVHYRRLIVDQTYLERLRQNVRLGERLWKFMKSESWKHFEWDLFSMARSVQRWIPGEQWPRGDPSGRFCSELVAETWRQMGFLARNTRPSDLYTVISFEEGNERDLDFPTQTTAGGEEKLLVSLGSTLDVQIT